MTHNVPTMYLQTRAHARIYLCCQELVRLRAEFQSALLGAALALAGSQAAAADRAAEVGVAMSENGCQFHSVDLLPVAHCPIGADPPVSSVAGGTICACILVYRTLMAGSLPTPDAAVLPNRHGTKALAEHVICYRICEMSYATGL